ncbi:YqeG family HAD IIIA-type phosphatase [Holzapfeliella sp. He02]|uniref:YqeG family HAD IIIA-type phosphatase n=1 Tax=Holzapfeliella saturejae TaxID=3082953 RepID=A0ABU8SIW7_9LACO
MSIFRPQYTIDTVYNLNPVTLKKMGIKTVFSDLDNTLVAWNQKETLKKISQLRNRLNQHEISLVVISNNKYERVNKILEPLGIEFIASAKKPFKKNLVKAMAQDGVTPAESLMIGDQILTDILAGNSAGMKTALVKPLIKSDGWHTWLNRLVEKFILGCLNSKEKITYQEDLHEQ